MAKILAIIKGMKGTKVMKKKKKKKKRVGKIQVIISKTKEKSNSNHIPKMRSLRVNNNKVIELFIYYL